MKKTSLWVWVYFCPLFSALAHADLVTDSSAELTLRNFYFDRDYKQDPYPYTAARDWAQGIIFNGQSGYTDGTVGFGVDVLAMAGFNLIGDRADDYARSNLLPVNADNSRDDYYGKIGADGPKQNLRKMSFLWGIWFHDCPRFFLHLRVCSLKLIEVLGFVSNENSKVTIGRFLCRPSATA